MRTKTENLSPDLKNRRYVKDRFSEFTLKEIHTIVASSESIRTAAFKLQRSVSSLSTLFNLLSINYEEFKNINPELLPLKFPYYDKTISRPLSLEIFSPERSPSLIARHVVISNGSIQLGCSPAILQSYLGVNYTASEVSRLTEEARNFFFITNHETLKKTQDKENISTTIDKKISSKPKKRKREDDSDEYVPKNLSMRKRARKSTLTIPFVEKSFSEVSGYNPSFFSESSPSRKEKGTKKPFSPIFEEPFFSEPTEWQPIDKPIDAYYPDFFEDPISEFQKYPIEYEAINGEVASHSTDSYIAPFDEIDSENISTAWEFSQYSHF